MKAFSDKPCIGPFFTEIQKKTGMLEISVQQIDEIQTCKPRTISALGVELFPTELIVRFRPRLMS